MSKLIDITGEKYGMLTVIARAENDARGGTMWECLCECGNKTIVSKSNLKLGVTKSCGCLRKSTKPTRKHGESHTKLYNIWNSMIRRCEDPKWHPYKNYGGRGIKVCAEWHDYTVFRQWANETRVGEGLTIERLDVNGDYCPENCTWVDRKTQANNRRSCVVYEYNGESHNLTQWCSIYNLPYWTVRSRIVKHGWSFEKAISTPIDVSKRNKGRKE